MSTNRHVAVVTGASQGIGAANAAAYLARGSQVVAVSRSIRPSDNEDVLAVAGDLGDPETGRRVVDEAIARFGHIDTLVNNAGIFVAGPFTGTTDKQYDDVVDAVLLWWREGDGDLVDALVDALTSLADGGSIWLLSPKAGRDGHVEPSDITEAAPTAGLSQTSSISAGREWSGARLVAPRNSRKR